MKLFYFNIATGNFGDDMNTWFWEDIFPEYHSIEPDRLMFGIGSLIGAHLLTGHEKVLVMGSGSGYGYVPDLSSGMIDFGWVRGPMTAQRLGLDPQLAITDPAIMTPSLNQFQGISVIPGKTVFIPHVGTDQIALNWTHISASSNTTYVSPTWDAQTVIREIASAERVITESLHGAIIADAFRVPWTAIAISPYFNMFKWQDWGQSMELEIDVVPSLRTPKAILRSMQNLRRGLRVAGGFLRSQQLHADGTKEKSFGPVKTGVEVTDKKRLRTAVVMFSGILENMIINDISSAQKKPPNLSTIETLSARQSQITERLQKIKTLY